MNRPAFGLVRPPPRGQNGCMATAPNIEAKRRAGMAALALHAMALRWLAESLPALPQEERDTIVERARRADSRLVSRQKEAFDAREVEEALS